MIVKQSENPLITEIWMSIQIRPAEQLNGGDNVAKMRKNKILSQLKFPRVRQSGHVFGIF